LKTPDGPGGATVELVSEAGIRAEIARVEDPIERLNVGPAVPEAEGSGAEIGGGASVAIAGTDAARGGVRARSGRHEYDHSEDHGPEGDPVRARCESIGIAEAS
jgi:hypothetical protein